MRIERWVRAKLAGDAVRRTLRRQTCAASCHTLPAGAAIGMTPGVSPHSEFDRGEVERVLETLARDPDPAIAGSAKTYLSRRK